MFNENYICEHPLVADRFVRWLQVDADDTVASVSLRWWPDEVLPERRRLAASTPDDFRQLANLGTACRGVTTTHE